MSYLDGFHHDEKSRLTLRLRKRIKNYNNNQLYNQKRVETENNSYFDLFNLTSNMKTNYSRPPLNRMSIIYRLSHSTDPKYLQLYLNLKSHLTNVLGFKFSNPEDEFSTINEIFRLYHEHNTESDTLENELKKNFSKYFPDQKIEAKVDAYYELHRILVTIDSQSAEIFSIPIQVDKKNFKEYKYKQESGSKTFRDLASLSPLEIYDQGESSEDEEVIVHRAPKVKRPDNVEVVNYFGEFYEKHKHMVFARDYWALFLNDVIHEIKSSRENEDLYKLFSSQDYFNNVEAAEYFIKHRKDIIEYCNLIAEQLPAHEEIRKPQIEHMDPMLLPSTEVSFLLDYSDKELQAEAQKHKLPVKREHKFKADHDLDDDGRVDFVKMNIQKLLTCLPFNSERKETENYVLFNIPPPLKEGKVMDESKLIAVNTLDDWAQKIFTGVKFLNTIQSKVKFCAYDTNENMLVAAPTGAGKTNVALLTIAHEIKKIIDPKTWQLKRDELKVIYVSPMKALAAEIVDKFSERLKPIGINVRELTGDMQLTKQEIQETQVIVTTPEKWDVITRKSDGITAKLRLIIIDEIHLLNDDRGPVLESIVARTLRMVERTQQRVRLLGLSATLPNPIDVAEFLRVDLEKGFFYFDASYRPIPLCQRYVGVKEDRSRDTSKMVKEKCEFGLNYGKNSDYKRRIEDVMNDICFDIVRKHLMGHNQVMVFVHSRKETMKFAIWLLERFKEKGEDHFLINSIHRDNTLGRLNHKELIKVCPSGIGFHNAGLLRQDRNIVEKLFLEGNLRILVTTATLAWGVNLPAHAVVIKGTDVYEPNYGDFIDLSILDIQQIFGRAGRPQFDTKGEATLITRVNKVNYYMGLLTNTQDIESQFLKSIKEALNAEISLGTVTNIYEAKEWLKYTFFYRRLLKRPDYYIPGYQKKSDPKAEIEHYLEQTITNTVEMLHKLRLIRYDQKTLFLHSTDLGGIASRYYIKAETMEHFENELKLNEDRVKSDEAFDLTDEALLSIVSRAKEFENIKLRAEEMDEINKVMRSCFLKLDHEFKSSTTDKNVDKNMHEQVYEDYEKVFVLMQGYLMHFEYENSSLVADTIYIVQNSMRILRCMMEICMKKNMTKCFQTLLYWSKLIENKMTPNDTPLSQFSEGNNIMNYSAMRTNRKDQKHGLLSSDLLYRLRDANFDDFYRIRDCDPVEISNAIGLKDRGQLIKKFASFIPKLIVKYHIKPVAQSILKVEVNIEMEMLWNARWHSKNEIFWLLADDEVDILHIEQIAISTVHINEKKKNSMFVSFYIPFQDDTKRKYRLIIESDRWIGSWYEEELDIKSYIANKDATLYTKLLDLDPLPKTALNNKDFESLYKFDYFNPSQTQVFHALFHTDNNVLVGAPTGSGKTNIAEMAMLRVFAKTPHKKIVYIAPLKALTKERIQDWRERLEEGKLKKKVLELTGDFTPDMEALMKADVIVSTPEKWDGISRSWQNRSYVKNVGLIILDEIHLLGQERGPVIEVIVSRMNYIAREIGLSTRMIGLSTALANGSDVATWFGVKPQYFFNFKPQVRPCPINIYFEGFSEKNYYPRMTSMNKPAYNAIKQHGKGRPTLMFVSSRRQTRVTAQDMISLIYSDTSNGGNFTQFLGASTVEINVYRKHIQDPDLKETLSYGIGIHHAGLVLEDRKIVEELFLKNKIQILIATSTLAWGVNFPAHLVIIKGTEYFDPKTKKYVDFPVVDLLQMIGRAGRPQFDTFGVACIFVEASKKNFYRKYLNDPFPVESNLEAHLSDHLNSEIASKALKTKQNCLEYLTWTFYFRRLIKNPTYYGVEDKSHEKINEFLLNTLEKCLKELQKDGCITITDNFFIESTYIGQIASLYYIKHSTAAYFAKTITAKQSVIELVKVLSNAREYDEVALRHGEEEINEKFYKQCPYQIGDKAYDSNHFKTFLLLQMYFSRLAPPVRDYLTDAKIVIDSCVRIIQAMIDIASDKGYYNTVVNLCYIMQMVVQGSWNNESFKNLPGFTDGMIKNLQEGENITRLDQLIEVLKKNELRDLLKRLNKDLKESTIKDIEDTLRYIPDVTMSASLKIKESEDKSEKIGILKVDVKRENSNYPLTVKMERYNKIKDCSWWIVCADAQQGELLNLKRLTFKDSIQKELKLTLPKSFEQNSNIELQLISDSYIGLDKKILVHE